MILVLNGYPGTGKLTIGQALAPMLGGKLVDIHTIYNLAFALPKLKMPEFFAVIEMIRVNSCRRISSALHWSKNTQ